MVTDLLVRAQLPRTKLRTGSEGPILKGDGMLVAQYVSRCEQVVRRDRTLGGGEFFNLVARR